MPPAMRLNPWRPLLRSSHGLRPRPQYLTSQRPRLNIRTASTNKEGADEEEADSHPVRAFLLLAFGTAVGYIGSAYHRRHSDSSAARSAQEAAKTKGSQSIAGSAPLSTQQRPPTANIDRAEVENSPQMGSSSTLSLVQQRPLRFDTTPENVAGARDELRALLGDDSVSEDVGTRVAHSNTAWSRAPRGDLDRPCLVVYPRTTLEASEVAKICHRRMLPSIAFSGGTSLDGTLAATHGEVCVDFSRMNKVLRVSERDLDATVQPGVGYVELNELLAADGLFFPPDPAPGAQIAGMISQGCSGTNAFRYGTMKDWVLGLTVVLADGTIIKTRHRPRKSSAGYNLTQLFVGSEGTLGWVTEATIKLTQKPESVKVGVAAFPTLRHAAEAAIKIVQSGVPVGALELLDGMAMRAINLGGYADREFPEKPTLFLKFSGSSSSVAEQIRATDRCSKEEHCVTLDISKNEEEAAGLWQARKTILWSILALRSDPSDGHLSADAAVPISRLGDLIEWTQAVVEKSGLVGVCVGHAGDGNIHASVLYKPSEEADAREVIATVQRMAVEMDGTVTGEHGIGLEHRDMLVHELGGPAIDAMRRVKFALDPHGLFNPDKMFRTIRPDS